MSKRCPICAGLGRILAFGACVDPIAVICPECAGLAITPASAEDHLRMYSVREITELLLSRPALPEPVEVVDQGA
jgi:excinuclease UvrABC ATPase subunit